MIKIKFNAQLANTTDSHPRRSIPISICNRDLARWHGVWNGRRQLAANLLHLFSAQFHAKRWTTIQNSNRCWLSSHSVTHFPAINAKNDKISFRWARALIAIGRFSLKQNHLNDCNFWWVEQMPFEPRKLFVIWLFGSSATLLWKWRIMSCAIGSILTSMTCPKIATTALYSCVGRNGKKPICIRKETPRSTRCGLASNIDRCAEHAVVHHFSLHYLIDISCLIFVFNLSKYRNEATWYRDIRTFIFGRIHHCHRHRHWTKYPAAKNFSIFLFRFRGEK